MFDLYSNSYIFKNTYHHISARPTIINDGSNPKTNNTVCFHFDPVIFAYYFLFLGNTEDKNKITCYIYFTIL